MGASDSGVTATGPPADVQEPPAKRRLAFPSAVTTLAIVTVVVWVAALFIPAGEYRTTEDGSPIPGTFEEVAVAAELR